MDNVSPLKFFYLLPVVSELRLYNKLSMGIGWTVRGLHKNYWKMEKEAKRLVQFKMVKSVGQEVKWKGEEKIPACSKQKVMGEIGTRPARPRVWEEEKWEDTLTLSDSQGDQVQLLPVSEE